MGRINLVWYLITITSPRFTAHCSLGTLIQLTNKIIPSIWSWEFCNNPLWRSLYAINCSSRPDMLVPGVAGVQMHGPRGPGGVGVSQPASTQPHCKALRFQLRHRPPFLAAATYLLLHVYAGTVGQLHHHIQVGTGLSSYIWSRPGLNHLFRSTYLSISLSASLSAKYKQITILNPTHSAFVGCLSIYSALILVFLSLV